MNRTRTPRRTRREYRRRVAAYVAAVRTLAPTIADGASEETLVRLGTSLLTLAALGGSHLDDALAVSLEHSTATRREWGSLLVAATTHLGPLLSDKEPGA
ncbi:hypothetical protein [Cellulosimicrobium cellulans]|uniref:Uncharacterized protein n=1 Tax=Cellulosimicrobium cellulans TaxID=1710 RepID=A0A4Y4E0Q2_CELCE|nr:hypothetical protein [Cellulosimicrobium cellulans]GED09168.1 hypothetical protein CCE02nite_11670 [Cellulosimicrobium cellulans]